MKDKTHWFTVTFETEGYKKVIIHSLIDEDNYTIDTTISNDIINAPLIRSLNPLVASPLINIGNLGYSFRKYTTVFIQKAPIVIHESTKKLLQEKDDKIADLENLIDDLNKQLGYESVEASLHEAKGNTDA
jgi:hypothetical protein